MAEVIDDRTATEQAEDLAPAPSRVREVMRSRAMLNQNSAPMAARRELDARQARVLRDQRPRRAADLDPSRTRRALAELDPRGDVHYDKTYGAAISSAASEGLRENQKEFDKYQMTRQQDIKKAEATIAPQFNSAKSQLDAQKQAALGTIPKAKSLDDEYNRWRKTWVSIPVYRGTPENPIQQYDSVVIPKEMVKDYGNILHDNGYIFSYNKVYLGAGSPQPRHNQNAADGDRGQSSLTSYIQNQVNNASVPGGRSRVLVYQQAELAQKAGKDQFYTTAAPQINKYNTDRQKAIDNVNQSYSQNLAQLQAERAAAEGKLQGAKLGLQQEVQAREEDLAQIRNSYKERLSRIDQALAAKVSRTEGSQSQQQEIKQIDSRVSAAQPQQQAAPLPAATPTYTR